MGFIFIVLTFKCLLYFQIDIVNIILISEEQMVAKDNSNTSEPMNYLVNQIAPEIKT